MALEGTFGPTKSKETFGSKASEYQALNFRGGLCDVKVRPRSTLDDTLMASLSTQMMYGQRIVTALIDSIARAEPEKPYALFPETSSFSGIQRHVTYADLARAINRAAWWLEEVLGRKRPGGTEVIAWIGPNDLRYCILSVGANKTAYTLLIPSPRNSAAFHVHIFRTTNCKVLLRDVNFDIGSAKAEMELNEIIVPPLAWFLDSQPAKEYPYIPDPSSMDERFLILHSSGSTGMPSCITFTHRSFAALDAVHGLSSVTASEPIVLSVAKGSFFNPFPMFHAAGLMMNLCFTIFYDHPLVLPAPRQLSADTVIDVLKHVDVSIALVPSSILEDLAVSPEAVKVMGKVKDVLFGGGPVSEEKVISLSKYTRLTALIATTESGLFPLVAHDSGEFNWFAFPAELKGIEFREAVNGLYEMVFVRDQLTDRYHSTWNTFPELMEYSTKDLYTKHSSQPGLWKHYGRIDDVLVLSNGEKVVTPPLEDILGGALEVNGVLIFGHGETEIGALIQRNSRAQSLSEAIMLDRLDPYILRGNQVMPKFANLSRDRVIFTVEHKPMIRAPKGSIIRSETIRLYAKEILDLRNRKIASGTPNLPLLKTDFSIAVRSLTTIFGQILGDDDIDGDTSLFDRGFDSVGVLKAMRRIQSSLQAEDGNTTVADLVTPNLLYNNATIEELAKAIRGLTVQDQSNGLYDTRSAAIDDTLQRHIALLPKTRELKMTDMVSDLVVVLTGSTGSLGSYVLDSLISSNAVSQVYALNRAINGDTAQLEASKSRRLSVDFKKVTFLRADLSKELLGLSTKDYDAIKSSARLIIHAQWHIDLNLSLEHFESHITGVRKIIELSTASPLHPRILFTSSIGAVGAYKSLNPDAGQIPEIILEDPRVSLPVGYAESKHISERLLNASNEKIGNPVSIARIGQIAGPVEKIGGMWNKSDWFPCLSISSAYLRLLPSDFGAVSSIDWIPVDVLGDVLLELALMDLEDSHEISESFKVYNIANPASVKWSDFIPTVLRHLPQGTEIVSMSAWIKALKDTASDSRFDIICSPATRLLEFYELIHREGIGQIGGQMEIVRGLKSPSLRKLEPVNSAWLDAWLRSWNVMLDD